MQYEEPMQAGALHIAASWRTAAAAAALAGALGWAWRGTLSELAACWSREPQYSHGFLVPLMAAALLWMRRERFAAARPGAWLGLAVIVVSCGLRLAGARFHVEWLEGMALLPCLAGLCLMIGGRAALKVAWPAIAFLVFMLPLPWRVETAMAEPLQRVATTAGTYVLQTAGYPAVARGNTIRLDDLTLGVAEACSGLRMLMVFFAISTAVAMLVRRPLWERVLIAASAVPIALLCNVARIAATGMLYASVGGETARWVFHDVAGWLMMPLALGLLALELKLLAALLIDVPSAERDAPITLHRSWSPSNAGADGGARVPMETSHA